MGGVSDQLGHNNKSKHRSSNVTRSILGESPGLGGDSESEGREFESPDTGWTFFSLICCIICIVCLKRLKINEKEAEDGGR